MQKQKIIGEEADNLNSSIFVKVIKNIVKNRPSKKETKQNKTPTLDTGKFYQKYKERLLILQKLF